MNSNKQLFMMVKSLFQKPYQFPALSFLMHRKMGTSTLSNAGMGKNLICLVLTLFVLCLVPWSGLHAQTYEDFVKQQQQDMQEFKEKREKEYQEFIEERDAYIQKMDQEFSDYLKQQWEEFKAFAGEQVPERPKPEEQPVFKTDEAARQVGKLKMKEPVMEKSPDKEETALPVMQKSIAESFATETLNMEFYGIPVNLEYDNSFVDDYSGEVNEETISAYWDEMNETNYSHLIDQLYDYKSVMNLNDWGYYLLVKEVAENISRDENAGIFLQWFLLTKSNYLTKLSFDQNRLFLMLASRNEIYGLPYTTVNRIKYYIVNGEADNVFTYEQNFPEARNYFDLNITSPFHFNTNNIIDKSISLNYQDKQYSFDIKYNKDLVDFYDAYPVADLKIYFDATVPAITKESIAGALRPEVQDKSEAEAVGFLLHFVQKGFQYKTDQEQFGREKFYFPEELFHYPYADCEDRSVLFAYLVKELLGLKVIGLAYDDHVSTAVSFHEEVTGDYLTYKGDEYIICDPTFINAPVGSAMPEYRTKTAEIIELVNNQYIARRSRNIWSKLLEAGANHGGSAQDIIFDAHENAYVTGYFNENITLGSTNLRSVNNSNDIFVARFNANDRLEWMKQFGAGGNDIAFNIDLDENGQVYFAGTFSDKVNFGSEQLNSGEQADAFVAKIDQAGKIEWAAQSGINDLDRENNLMFVSSIASDGGLLWTRLYNESESYRDYGLNVNDNGEVFFTGSLYASTGLKLASAEFESYSAFDAVSGLKEENDKLISNAYHPSIAGVFAVINQIRNSGVSLPGRVAQQALDKYNPSFKKNSPGIYENIGKVEFIRNAKGIVIVRTDNGSPVNFSYLKVNNDAKLKIISFNSGNAQIDILSGVSVGKSIIWYDLNFIKLYKKDGNLLFDYDDDHTQKLVNLKEDIL